MKDPFSVDFNILIISLLNSVTLVTENGEVKLLLTMRLNSCWLALMVPAGIMGTAEHCVFINSLTKFHIHINCNNNGNSNMY